MHYKREFELSLFTHRSSDADRFFCFFTGKNENAAELSDRKRAFENTSI